MVTDCRSSVSSDRRARRSQNDAVPAAVRAPEDIDVETAFDADVRIPFVDCQLDEASLAGDASSFVEPALRHSIDSVVTAIRSLTRLQRRAPHAPPHQQASSLASRG